MSSYNFITQHDVFDAYKSWLKNAANYYHGTDYDVEPMSDELWTELGDYYAKYLSGFPFLSKIGFTGSSMYNVTLEQLVEEIES